KLSYFGRILQYQETGVIIFEVNKIDIETPFSFCCKKCYKNSTHLTKCKKMVFWSFVGIGLLKFQRQCIVKSNATFALLIVLLITLWFFKEIFQISGLRRRKLPKTKGTFVPSSSASLKMTWSKEDEISILSGILDYQEESKSSYNQKYDAFYDYIREYMKLDFSKQQLIDKVKKLKKRFRENQARSNDGKELSFTDTDEEEVFELSKSIWAEKETERAYEENKGQTKENVPCAERERTSNANTEINNGEKEKNEVDGVDDLSVLLGALEAATSFQSLNENLQKFLRRNMKNVGANQRKELIDEWKTLLADDMQLDIKKLTFSAKIVNVGFSA
ncbi:unnamed protein product, partial [Arabidopsis halleri]